MCSASAALCLTHIAAMHPIRPTQAYPLFSTASTRVLEQAAARFLPSHTLMQRAGLAVARLAMALAPHSRTVWIACGPGNNGGDGLEAAMHLRRQGRRVVVTWLGHPESAPSDARASWEGALSVGVEWADSSPQGLTRDDLCIDALLGIGVSSARQTPARPLDGRMQQCLQALRALQAEATPLLAVDVPSGLDADTGQFAAGFATAAPTGAGAGHYTLSLLTLKPGLFTASGRDAAGQVWLDNLGIDPAQIGHGPPDAWLSAPPEPPSRTHASHKGSYGDVAVVGGEGLAARGMGMTGAALLAASAALHSGAGRVLVALLDDGHLPLDAQQPELMFRRFDALMLEDLTVVCGCGGGQAVAPVLPAVITRAARLVLDADALNIIATRKDLCALVAARSQRGLPTVLTPHPLEAARLLGLTTAEVQGDRLESAQQLADAFQCVAVLKGSGSVIASPDGTSALNPTGNARLATAGTGDVLAGMVGARLAAGVHAAHAARGAVYLHGQAADDWPQGLTLTASALARRVGG